MAPPPTLPRQRLRYTRILDVAAGFARKGLASVVLSEVAAKADVPLGTLYRYFPSATQLMLALYRKQLTELHPASSAAPPAGKAGDGVPAHSLAGVVMEIFHMRLMQPAVEQCLNKAVYTKGTDTTKLLREITGLSDRVRELRARSAMANTTKIKALEQESREKWAELRALRAAPAGAPADAGRGSRA